MGSLDAVKGFESRTGSVCVCVWGDPGLRPSLPHSSFASYLFPVAFLTAHPHPRTSSSYLCTLHLSWYQDCHAVP